jgi:hypothetical protein
MARCLVQPGQIGSLFPNAAVSGEVKDWDDSCDLVLRFAKVTGGPTKSRPRIAPVLKLLECYCRFLLLVVDLHVMRFCAGCGSAGRVDGSDPYHPSKLSLWRGPSSKLVSESPACKSK